MLVFYVYIYRDPGAPYKNCAEPIYVGKGQKKRAWEHLKRVDKHPFTNRLRQMARNNILPEIEIIPAIDEAHAHFLEECLIDCIGRRDLDRGPLLNLTNGGEGSSGRILSDEEKLNKSRMKKIWWSDSYNRQSFSKNASAARQHPDIKAHASFIQKIAQNRQEVQAKRSKSKSRACTVDDMTFFSSRKSLIETLGSGKNGRRHPNFHYIGRASC